MNQESVTDDKHGAGEIAGVKAARRRNVPVRPTAEQLTRLHELARRSGYKSLSQYLIDRGLYDGVMLDPLERSRTERMLFEVRRIGRNINQIATHMSENRGGYSPEEVDRALREVERVVGNIRTEMPGDDAVR